VQLWPLASGVRPHAVLREGRRLPSRIAGRSSRRAKTEYVQIDFAEPIGALYGDRAVLRDHGPANPRRRTGCRPVPPRRGRRLSARLAVLEAAANPIYASFDASVGGRRSRRCCRIFALVRNLAPLNSTPLPRPAGFFRVGRRPRYRTPRRGRSVLRDRRGSRGLHAAHPTRFARPSRPYSPSAAVAPEAALDGALSDLAASGRSVREGRSASAEHRPRLTPGDERAVERVRPLLAVRTSARREWRDRRRTGARTEAVERLPIAPSAGCVARVATTLLSAGDVGQLADRAGACEGSARAALRRRPSRSLARRTQSDHSDS